MIILTQKLIIPKDGEIFSDTPKDSGEYINIEVDIDPFEIVYMEDKYIAVQIGDRKGRTEIIMNDEEHLLVIESEIEIKKLITEMED